MDNHKENAGVATVYELEGGDVRLWIEQEAIHLKACDSRHGDPAELTAESARELAKLLLKMADQIDD